ncbi:hypothetical protein BJX68DRAFT_8255 [Aspergillus pseudodeflectus]|uniref:Uncharacterized protein n=1 Tax=Aspergillus pseudodeflectus TaxID=176178 RepID=A0ABR4LAJ7_9EURO
MRPLTLHANPTSPNEVESSVVMSNSVTRTHLGNAVSNDSGICLLLVRTLYSMYWPVGRRGPGRLLVLAWQKHQQSLISHQQTRPRIFFIYFIYFFLKCRIQPTPTRRDSHSYPRTKRSSGFSPTTPTIPRPTPSLRRRSSSPLEPTRYVTYRKPELIELPGAPPAPTLHQETHG